MASSSVSKGESKSAKSTKSANVPDRYASKADVTFSYCTKTSYEAFGDLSEDAWTPLSGTVSVTFANRIIITQGDDKAACVMTLMPGEYDYWQILEVKKNVEFSAPLTVIFKSREKKATISFTGQELEEAYDSPLANLYIEFYFIRLIIPIASLVAEGGKAANSRRALNGHLKTLMTGRETLDTESGWHKILYGDQEAIRAETAAQDEQLGLFKGCRLQTRKGRTDRTIIVEIYPTIPDKLDNPDEAKHYDFNRKVGLSYWIRDSKLFPSDKEVLEQNPVLGTKTAGWELIIVKGTEGTGAAMTGQIRNTFKGDLGQFIGEDTDVELEPIVNDILAMRSRNAVGKITKELDAFSMKARGFFEAKPGSKEDDKPKSQLPGLRLFGGDKYVEEENQLSGESLPISREILDILNEAQNKGLEMMLGHMISIAWGPPGTGKSLLLACLARLLLTKSDEKFVGTAMANVAVDSLMDACIKLWRRTEPNVPPPFARVYSEAQIESQWLAGDHDFLSGEFHLDQLRFKRAQQNPARWDAYLAGRREMQEYGRMMYEEPYKAYNKQAKLLSAEVLDKDVRGVFCTVSNCQTPALYQEDGEGDVKRVFKATTIVADEAGTVLRPHLMLLLMTFVYAKRLVLAGDHKQLPALLLSELGKSWWSKSYLRDIMKNGWPVTLLDIQYRMHDALYAHLVALIYKKPIRSAYSTDNPSSFLNGLLDIMPLRVDTSSETFELKSFMHFIDVRGEQQTRPGGSSSNPAEVELIDALVKSLILNGQPRKSICVMTGYQDQLKLLQRTSNEQGWGDIAKVLTIDSSQGAEYKILIISLVSTRGLAGFMNQPERACVMTSRQGEALFCVGNGDYWFKRKHDGFNMLHKILVHMRNACEEAKRPSFIVRSLLHATYDEATASHAVQPTFRFAPIDDDPEDTLDELEADKGKSAAQMLADWEGQSADVLANTRREHAEALEQFKAQQAEEYRQKELEFEQEEKALEVALADHLRQLKSNAEEEN